MLVWEGLSSRPTDDPLRRGPETKTGSEMEPRGYMQKSKRLKISIRSDENEDSHLAVRRTIFFLDRKSVV